MEGGGSFAEKKALPQEMGQSPCLVCEEEPCWIRPEVHVLFQWAKRNAWEAALKAGGALSTVRKGNSCVACERSQMQSPATLAKGSQVGRRCRWPETCWLLQAVLTTVGKTKDLLPSAEEPLPSIGSECNFAGYCEHKCSQKELWVASKPNNSSSLWHLGLSYMELILEEPS